LRRRWLDEVENVATPAGAAALLEAKEDGRVKLLVTSRALNFRRKNHKLFSRGAYTPLECQGPRQDNLLAFARTLPDRQALVVAPLRYARLTKAADITAPVTGSVWADTWLNIPGVEAGQKYCNRFTGEELIVKEQNGLAGLALEEVLAAFPVALLEKI
jgi:(1->4)-alpha-D-glucan 1-alpha-D-glucosylmutase